MSKKIVYSLCFCVMMCAFSACSENVTDEGIQTLKIDTEADAVELVLDDYADYTLIPLETIDSVLIGRVADIKVHDGVLAVSTSEENILFFDLKGNFQGMVSHKGDGPEDYLTISGFYFTREGNVLIGSAPGNMKLYDPQNRFLRSFHIPGYDLTLLGNELYTYEAKRASTGRVVVYSMETGDSLCAFSAVEPYTVIDLAIPFKPCSEQESYYIPAFSDTIYTVKDHGQTPKFALDFGSVKAKSDLFEEMGGNPFELFPKLMESHQVVSVEMFNKGSKYCWMQTLQFDGDMEDGLNVVPISKSFCIQPDGQSVRFDKLVLNKYQNLPVEFSRLLCADGTHFACSVNAGDLMEYAETLSPEDRKAFMEQLELTSEEQNPYILLVNSK